MSEEKIAIVWENYFTCVETMVPDLSTQDILVGDLAKYKNVDGLFGSGQDVDGLFGSGQAVRARDTRALG